PFNVPRFVSPRSFGTCCQQPTGTSVHPKPSRTCQGLQTLFDQRSGIPPHAHFPVGRLLNLRHEEMLPEFIKRAAEKFGEDFAVKLSPEGLATGIENESP